MELDPAVLARIQFAVNITFHILFPTITIALAWVLFFFKIRFHLTGKTHWMEAYRFWTKVFALCFALGVVSGITMSFQFGTNWPGFMETVGNIAGPLLAYEVLSAFFLEATFLGIMLYGMKRVPPWLHTLATFLVAAGTTLSAFWILVLNSWMQGPTGFEMIQGVAHATNWFQIFLNPTFPYVAGHMLMASGLTAAFLIAGLSSYRWLRGDRSCALYAALKTGLVLALILMPLQIAMGDAHGRNTHRVQPQKFAAMEGLWRTQQGAPLLLFALPNSKERSNSLEIGIPKLGSFLATHDPNAVLRGLNDFADHPLVAPVFWSFRIMVGTGLAMLFTAAAAGLVFLIRKDLTRRMAQVLVAMTFSGWVATVSGWYVSEIGRQPWLVFGLLKTEQARSDVSGSFIGLSLSLYLSIYVFLLVAFVTTIFYMARKASDPVSGGPAHG